MKDFAIDAAKTVGTVLAVLIAWHYLGPAALKKHTGTV
jgi:hypothetical protein